MAVADRSRHEPHDDATLVLEERFAVVPEWLLDADISDCAVRLYAVLLRYGQVSGARMPSRATLARRLRKKSTDTVDRAMRELVDLGAVVVTPRWSGRERLTNAYRLITTRPTPPTAAGAVGAPRQPDAAGGGSRTDAATTSDAASRPAAGGRTLRGTGGRNGAARVAASVRHNPEFFTERETPPPGPSATGAIAADCGIADWPSFVAECVDRRRKLHRPPGRWAGPCLDAALQLAVRGRSWPANLAADALLAVAADPESRSPMRVAEAGPWWDGRPLTAAVEPPTAEEVEAAESELLEVGGLRVKLQSDARRQLAAEGVAATRATVVVRAAQLLREGSMSGSRS